MWLIGSHDSKPNYIGKFILPPPLLILPLTYFILFFYFNTFLFFLYSFLGGKFWLFYCEVVSLTKICTSMLLTELLLLGYPHNTAKVYWPMINWKDLSVWEKETFIWKRVNKKKLNNELRLYTKDFKSLLIYIYNLFLLIF